MRGIENGLTNKYSTYNLHDPVGDLHTVIRS